MEVLERNPNGWWYCQILDGVKPFKGWVPSTTWRKELMGRGGRGSFQPWCG